MILNEPVSIPVIVQLTYVKYGGYWFYWFPCMDVFLKDTENDENIKVVAIFKLKRNDSRSK